MFDTFFTQIKVRSRMESGPIGPYLSEIAAVLHRDGYTRGTIRRHLRAADHFGAWLLKQGMVVTDISTSTVDRLPSSPTHSTMMFQRMFLPG